MPDADFDQDWLGWRLRGRYLISPDGQRITRERLAGLLFRDELELRRAGFASRRRAEQNRGQTLVKVVVVRLAELRRDGRLAS